MRGKNVPKPVLAKISLLLALCFVLSVPFRAAADAASDDLLQFLDGDVIHGVFMGMEPGKGVRWEHPDVKGAFDLRPTHIDFVRFNHTQPVVMSPTCHFRFVNGDDLFGSLVSMNSESVEFTSWFGGAMKVPRAAVQTITFLPKGYSTVYEGPTDASNWAIAGQQGRTIFRGGGGLGGFGGGVIILGGGMIIGQGGNTITSNPGGPPYWTYQDGSFISTGMGSLGRNFNLTNSSTIEFDLTCSGQFSLLVDFYSPTLERIDLNNGSFLLELDSGPALGGVGRARNSPTQNKNMLGSVQLPGMDKPGTARIAIQCNKEEGTIAVLQDGVEINRWTDPGSFDGLGGGILFQNQSPGTIKLSNMKVSQWEGGNAPDVTSIPATNSDAISFVNHDKAGGKVESVTDGKLNVMIGGNLLHIPTERLQKIEFAQEGQAAMEPRGPWEVRAVFPGGGSVSFQLDKWDDRFVSGHSALFGSLSFHPAGIREMRFNLDRPKNPPTAAPLNEYELLDQ